jgi:ATP-dependent DNA helicase RecQ
VFEDSIRRNNLHLHIKFTPNKERQLFRLLSRLEGTGIIYAKTRRSCESLAELLQNNGHSADFYHAGLLPDEKEQRQEAWLSNDLRMIVSTTAFGMGIDKSDVNWVVYIGTSPIR